MDVARSGVRQSSSIEYFERSARYSEHVAPRLTHEPHGRDVGGLAAGRHGESDRSLHWRLGHAADVPEVKRGAAIADRVHRHCSSRKWPMTALELARPATTKVISQFFSRSFEVGMPSALAPNAARAPRGGLRNSHLGMKPGVEGAVSAPNEATL